MPHNQTPQSEFLFYTSPEGDIKIDVFFQDETVWLTQKKMAELFGVEPHTITYHLGEIYKNEEIDEKSTHRKIRAVQTEGERQVSREFDYYNLDAIISVGYRVNSARATQFRVWATKTLRTIILNNNRKIDFLSLQTLIKVSHRIDQIKEIIAHLADLKLNIPPKEHEFAYSVYFIAIATLYRSLFKGLDKGFKINIGDLTDNQDYIDEIHGAIMTIVDQDTVHMDKRSKTHKIHDVEGLKKGGSTVLGSSLLDENQLQEAVHFLDEKLLPLIKHEISEKMTKHQT